MKKLTKFLMLLMVVVLGVSFVACQGSRTRTDKNNLKFLHIWPEHEVAMNKIVSDFMSDNPGVTIDTSVVPHDQVDRVLQSAYIGGTLPDVFFYWSDKMYKWTNDNIPMDLTPYVGEWKKDYIADGVAWEAGKVDDKYYAAPFRATGFLILYNKTMFDAHPQWAVPTTLQELEQLAAKIKADEPSMIPLGAYGGSGGSMYQVQTALGIFESIASGKTEDPNYRTGRLAPDYTDNAGVKVVEKFKSYIDAGFFGPNPHSKKREDVIADFINMNSAMCLFNNNELGILREGIEEENVEIDAFAIPAPKSIDAKYIFGTYDSFCVSNTAPNTELAVKFIKYLTSAAVQQEWANTEKSIMMNKDVTYQDPMQNRLAGEMNHVGKYDIYPDYSSGDKGDINFQLMVSFLNGTYKKGALELLKEQNANTLSAMKDSMLNPPNGLNWIDAIYNKKEYDRSWLEPIR